KALTVDFDEVAVTRRLYRTGESEYYINRVGVRLRDINELFMNTGLGRDGYSIIGQGKISDVLTAKSEDRRLILEEAAGISKYRYRKQESEKKLSVTEENLSRVRDILHELEERVEPLRIQSEKARKFLDLREERKQLEINVWLDSIDKTKDEKEELDNKYHMTKDSLDLLQDENESSEREMDECSAAMQECNLLVEQLQNSIRDKEEEAASLQSERAVTVNDIEHHKERLARIKESIEQGQLRFKEFEDQIASKRSSMESIKQDIDKKEQELSDIVSESERRLSEQSDITETLEKVRAQMTVMTGEATDAKIKLASFESSIENAAARLNTIENELAEREALRNDKEKELLGINEQLEDVAERISGNSNIISGYQRKLEARKSKLDELNAKQRALDNSVMEKSQRIRLLTDMEKHYEGFTSSVKVVMREAERGRLRGVCGPVSELIKVEGAYTLAIETALGGAVQHIVVEREEDAKAAILMLKNENGGRSTFLPLSAVRGSGFNETGVDRCEGFVGIASSLLTYDSKYENVFKSLLGRTVVVEHIDNAIAMARRFGYRFKIVTLDGQVVNAGGSMTGGSQVRGSGVLSRKNEIETLNIELVKLKSQAGEVASEADKLAVETASISASLDGAVAENNVAREQQLRLEGEAGQYKMLLDTLNDSVEALQNERKSINLQNETAQKQADELSALINATEQELSRLEGEYETLSGSHEEALKNREQLQTRISDGKFEIAALKKDVEMLEAGISDILRQKELFSSELGTIQQETETINANIEDLNNKITQLDGEALKLQENISNFREDIKKANEKRDLNEKRIAEIRKSSKDMVSRREGLIRELTRLEGKKASLETEYDNIISRLWEEYELTLTDSYALRTELENPAAAAKRIAEIKNKMKSLGDVNVGAIEEYKTVNERYEFLKTQVDDLEKAKSELTRIIESLTEEMKKIFSEQFKAINEQFGRVFIELFGGGNAKLELSDPGNVLESGIDIAIQPPGKIIKNLSALSGGEQAFVAIALYFAIMVVKPSPFCILDEIEAALDDVNVSRFAGYLEKMARTSQFICVTHRRGTMEHAGILYGVTMQESGVTKLLTINVADVEKHFGNTL
ncbi:MAG: chromosome segregation protein SMC, partial [Bacillota bacterium]|nr:chromosome segregation protein SMC [Bacillota bacterium]